MVRKKSYNLESEEFSHDDEVKRCPVCGQEYAGVCPIKSAACPFEADEDAEDEDALGPDFDDVENVDKLIGADEEADAEVEEEDAEKGDAGEDDR